MTGTLYIQNFEHDPKCFGGTITGYDFDGYTPMATVAGKILSDQKFDERCRKALEQRNKYKKKFHEE